MAATPHQRCAPTSPMGRQGPPWLRSRSAICKAFGVLPPLTPRASPSASEFLSCSAPLRRQDDYLTMIAGLECAWGKACSTRGRHFNRGSERDIAFVFSFSLSTAYYVREHPFPCGSLPAAAEIRERTERSPICCSSSSARQASRWLRSIARVRSPATWPRQGLLMKLAGASRLRFAICC